MAVWLLMMGPATGLRKAGFLLPDGRRGSLLYVWKNG